MKKRFVILDRDGTVIQEKNHLTEVSEVELIPNAAYGIKKFHNLGFGVIIVTNQSVVGNKHISLNELKLIHERMLSLLTNEGAVIDAIYFCPHTPEENCLCRKPKLGMIDKACKDYNFNPKDCFVIGDKALDIEMGQRMGAKTILVSTGYGAAVEKENKIKPDYIVDDLKEAANVIKKII